MGDLAPPQGHLAMFSDICDNFSCHSYWIRDRKAAKYPYNSWNSPHNKELWAPNGNNTETEKPLFKRLCETWVLTINSASHVNASEPQTGEKGTTL